MARLTKRASGRPKPAMNVTPLVDIVLVLLIIFMVVIPAMEEGVTIELPSMVNVDPEGDQRAEPFVLSISQNGALFLDEVQLPPDDFEARLAAANEAEPTRRLLLRGDFRVKYEQVRELFAICQRIGFPGVSLKVNQPQTDEEQVAQNGAR